MRKAISRKDKRARRVPDINVRSDKASHSEAQRKRDRQQIGVAAALAQEAEKLFPALQRGVLLPDQLVEQAKYVVEIAKLETERHRQGQICDEHRSKIISSMREFAAALDQIGVKVPGLLHVKQSHYLDVIALWEKSPPGEALRVRWILSHVRRMFVTIGRPSVVPRGARNRELLAKHGLALGSKGAFLVNTYVDWEHEGLDVELVFQAMRDPGKRAAAELMYFWGMSLLEVAAWRPVDPAHCSFLRLENLDGRRGIREAEISLDRAFAAGQMAALKQAWDYCRQHGRSTLCPTSVSPPQHSEHLRMSIRHVLSKVYPGRGLTPMQLRDGFFCRVFRDHAGTTLSEARKNPWLAEKDNRLALAWNEAKRQLGVRGARAPQARMPFSQSQSMAIARSLRFISPGLASFGVCSAWVGDVDATTGKCLFVQLPQDAQKDAGFRIQELLEQAMTVKLRVVHIVEAHDVPDSAVPVVLRLAA
jgi:hypothetical protein